MITRLWGQRLTLLLLCWGAALACQREEQTTSRRAHIRSSPVPATTSPQRLGSLTLRAQGELPQPNIEIVTADRGWKRVTSLPHRIEAIVPSSVTVKVRTPGYEVFDAEVPLTLAAPSVELALELLPNPKGPHAQLGYLPGELPRDHGFARAAGALAGDRGRTILFEYETAGYSLQPCSSGRRNPRRRTIYIDEVGSVWRRQVDQPCPPHARSPGSGETSDGQVPANATLVGVVSHKKVKAMTTLLAPAVLERLARFDLACVDCATTTARARATPDEKVMILARAGRAYERRAGSAADEVVRWLVAVCTLAWPNAGPCSSE